LPLIKIKMSKKQLTKEQRRVLLPEDVVEFIRDLAKQENRSLKDQVTHIVLDYKKRLK